MLLRKDRRISVKKLLEDLNDRIEGKRVAKQELINALSYNTVINKIANLIKILRNRGV